MFQIQKLHPKKPTAIQWINSEQTYTQGTGGTNDLLITPAGASPASKPIFEDITITVGDDSVATVDYEEAPENGVISYFVNPLAGGETTVTATYSKNGVELTDTFALTVEALPDVETLAFPDDMPTELPTIGPGSETNWLFMEYTPNPADVTSLVIESSDDTKVEVQQNPINKAKFMLSTTQTAAALDEVTITATIGEITQTATITIVQNENV